jgi:Ner family transcriptional regulator
MAGWHSADIIAALHKSGTTLEELGLKNGKAKSSMSAALLKPSRGCNQIIADKIGVSLHVLWPEWFDAKGRLLSQNGRENRRSPSSQKRFQKLSVLARRA